MKKFILLSLLFVSSYTHAMDSSQSKSSLLGFDDSGSTFSDDMKSKIENLSFYSNSIGLFPYVKVTLDTGESRQRVQYKEGQLMGIKETTGSECLIILQNGKKHLLFPSSVTNIEKALTKGEKILLALQTVNSTIENTIQSIINGTSTSNSTAKAKITYTDMGLEFTIIGYINEPTQIKAKLGRYSVLPVIIPKKRTFNRKDIPLAHIIAIEKVNPKLQRSKSTSPKASRKHKSRKRASSTK